MGKKLNVHDKIDHNLRHRSYEDERRIPLPGVMMMASILGLIISVIFTFSGRFNIWFAWTGDPYKGYAWGTAFIVVFLIVFISSLVSITPTGKELDEIR